MSGSADIATDGKPLPFEQGNEADEAPYAEPPGDFDVKDLVQEREAEGGVFVQTAGIHRADLVAAFLEMAYDEAEAVSDEFRASGGPETDLTADAEDAVLTALIRSSKSRDLVTS